MIGFGRGDYFNGQVYGEMIVSDAENKKRSGFLPELNYEKLVEKIAAWLEGWLLFAMPRPGELMDLLSDAFLLVMKSKRKLLTMENYYEFMEGENISAYETGKRPLTRKAAAKIGEALGEDPAKFFLHCNNAKRPGAKRKHSTRAAE